MRKIKQTALRTFLQLLGLMIVFLISCKSNNDKSTPEDQPSKPAIKDSLVNNTKPAIVDSNNNAVTPIPIIKKPRKHSKVNKDSVSNTIIHSNPNPVCKYGVIYREKKN
jgi:hypothetical protein